MSTPATPDKTPNGKPFDLETFTYNGHTLRTVVIDGKLWFLVKDVGAALRQHPAAIAQSVRAATDVSEVMVIRRKEAFKEAPLEVLVELLGK